MSTEIINYRPSWQVLRVSFLKENNPFGGLITPDGAHDAIARMNNYILDAKPSGRIPQYVADEISLMDNTIEQEYAARIYRVINFLTATLNGLAEQDYLQHLVDLKSYSDSLHSELNLPLVDAMAASWNWDVVQYEMETIWRRERSWFMAILSDMRQRVVEKDKTGTYMNQFIAIMTEINR